MKNLPTWMPGAGFKRNAYRIRGLVRAMMDTPYEMVGRAMVRTDELSSPFRQADTSRQAAGTARPSFTASLLEETYGRNGPSAEEAEDIKGAAGVIYGGTSHVLACKRHA